ncbi:oxidoreductase [Agreia sp.]|uniref:oxidoreductase n=1 Tax=Agreia sp. TaxID=1872416 RepID=UPI0035BC53A9
MEKKVALVTGASSGIGGATARELMQRGFVVYGGARRVERMADIQAQGVHTISLDVTDERSVTEAVSRIERETGRLDALVNNAGYGSYGAVEDVTLAEGRKQFDVNVFGVMRLTQAVLPIMRRQGSGKIVNVTSVGGKIYTPFGAWYHGTKFALEGMSDALRLELAPFGIDVIVVEPGAIKTEWSSIAAGHLRETSGHGPYAEQATRVAQALTSGPLHDRASDPSVIAMTIATAVTIHRPKTRYAAGFSARPVLALRRLLSDRAFDKLITRSTR